MARTLGLFVLSGSPEEKVGHVCRALSNSMEFVFLLCPRVGALGSVGRDGTSNEAEVALSRILREREILDCAAGKGYLGQRDQ